MADQRKTTKARKRKEASEPTPAVPDKATKEEYNIARWMRNNVPVKKTKFLSHTVEYFTACKAVDKLLDSPWAQPKKPGEEALFTTRESVVEYLDTMLRHKLFHRARKIIVPENELKSKKKRDKEERERANKKEDKETSDRETKPKTDEGEQHQQLSGAEGKSKKEEGDKRKKKVRLDMHLEQTFVDGIDAYVWIYEPTPYYYYIFGFLVVVAVIAICLFPLWPSSVRQGVYYLSLAAAGFLVFILALAVIRLIVFCIVWGLSFGHRHLWLLPNLTEDVGFFASFWPLYHYEYKGNGTTSDEQSSKEEGEAEPNSELQQGESGKSESENLTQLEQSVGVGEANKNDTSHSETESDASQKSQTGRDFELIDAEEVES